MWGMSAECWLGGLWCSWCCINLGSVAGLLPAEMRSTV